mmetsp:Transcript_83791/g.147557  ORF Transcript_83791/g.147557 Transcript_83791/m.147557 type:complete len:96 (-) Transcript_83791:3-290(-)
MLPKASVNGKQVRPSWSQVMFRNPSGSQRQGVKRAALAMGEEVLQNMVLQFKKAESKEAADGVLRAALAFRKISDHQIRSSCSQDTGVRRTKGGG